MRDNPFFTKYGFSLFLVFLLVMLVAHFVTDALGIFIPQFDEDGEISNGFDVFNAVPAVIACYLLEGIIAVKLNKEHPEYAKRKHKEVVLVLLCLYFVAIVMFLVLKELGVPSKINLGLSTAPLGIYGTIKFYSSHSP